MQRAGGRSVEGEGSRTIRLTPEQAEIAGKNWTLALSVAAYFRKRYPSLDADWEGAVALGLCQVAATYQPSRGTTFGTHADARLKGSCLDLMRSMRVKGYGKAARFEGAPKLVSLEAIDFGPGRPDTMAGHFVSGDDPVGWNLESGEEFERLIRPLPWSHKEALRLIYLYGFTLKRVGRVLGLSEPRISRIRLDALAILRDGLKLSGTDSRPGVPRKTSSRHQRIEV